MAIRSLVVGLGLTIMNLACSTIAVRTRADLTIQRPSSPPLRVSYENVGTYSLSSLSGLCIITGILYGGACWYYLALPDEDEVGPERRQLQSLLTRIGPCATSGTVRIEGAGWGKVDGNWPALRADDGRTIGMAELEGACNASTPTPTPTPPPDPTPAPPPPEPVLAPTGPPIQAPKSLGNGAVLAVFDVEDPSRKFSKTTTVQLTDYLSARIAQVHRFRVVPREQIRSRLAEAKADSYRACVDQACQIELGKALAAEKSLATKLLRIGDSCALTATLFDLRTETTERAASVRTKCSDEDLIEALEKLIDDLGSSG